MYVMECAFFMALSQSENLWATTVTMTINKAIFLLELKLQLFYLKTTMTLAW